MSPLCGRLSTPRERTPASNESTVQSGEAVDLEIINAVIFDGQEVLAANRVSIRDGIITTIANDPAEQARPEPDPGVRTIDAAGRLLTPGFLDAHVHTVFGGVESLTCDLSAADGVEAALAVVRAHIEAHPATSANPAENWITGGGWSMADFPGGAPHAALLDALSLSDAGRTDRPIILISRDHHSAWVNSAAMTIAGLDASTPTPAGGVIEKDEDGAPIGCLHESAMDLVGTHVPPATDAQILAGLVAGQAYLNSLGITGWMDALIGDYSGHRSPYDAYVAAAAGGELISEVVGSLWWPRDVTDVDAQVAHLVDLRSAAESSAADNGTAAGTEARGAFRANSVKFMLDGIVESRTAAMTHEYSCACGGFGTSYFERDHLHAAFAALDAAGFDIHCHAIGDGAVRAALDAFEAIGTGTGDSRPDARHHIAHVQIVDPIDVPRFAELNITANLQALWACRDQQMIDLNIPNIGVERANWQYPFRSFVDASAHLAMGSDWPVSTADPWQAIHNGVTRTTHDDGDGQPLVADQAIDLITALRAYTAGSAHLLRSSDNGRIAVGARANLALASANPFDLEPTELDTVSTVLTVAGGDIVFEA